MARENGVNAVSAFLGFGLVIWASVLSLQYAFMTDYTALVTLRSNQTLFYFQTFGLLFFLVSAAIANFIVRGSRSHDRRIGLINLTWIGFFSYTFLLSINSLKPFFSIAYIAALITAILAMRLVARLEPFVLQRIFTKLALVLLFCLIFLLVKNGFTGRTIGWIPPNNIGKVAFVGVVFAIASNAKRKYFLILLHFSFLLLVNSRGMLISATFFTLIYMWHSAEIRRFTIVALAFMFFNFFVLMTLVQVILGRSIFIFDLANLVLALDDAERGLSSGLTGRTDYWRAGLQLFAERPLFGYGFRTRESSTAIEEVVRSAHSGWINLGIDTGIVGLVMIIVLFCMLIYFSAQRCSDTGIAAQRISSAAFAYFIVVTFIWLIEPTYFNFGVVDIIPFIIFSAFAARIAATARAC